MSTSDQLDRFLNTPTRSFFVLWVPLLFSLVAEPLTGLVDTAFVARLGAEPLAALGVGTALLTGGLWLFNFLSVGSQTEVSQAFGRGDLESGRCIGSLAVFLGLLIGCATALTAYGFAPLMSAGMGAVGEVHDHAVTYIRIRAFGGPAVLISMTSFGILYGMTDMRTPLLVALAVNGLNVILDWLLIFGFGPLPAMGIAGAALASSISQWVGALWCLIAVHRKITFTHKLNFGDVTRLLAIGRDMLIRTGSLILFLLLATRAATKLGPDAGAAHQAIRQVWMFTSLFLDASAITGQSVVGYYLGAGRIAQARIVARIVCQWSFSIGAVLLLVMVIGTGLISTMLVPESGRLMFRPAWFIAAMFQPFAALAFVTDGIHWGTRDFRFLRNAVVFATICSSLMIVAAEGIGCVSLTLIWWIIGIWIVIRAGWGIVRIWPGMKGSPLSQPAARTSNCCHRSQR